MTRICITGASGYLGGHISSSLAELGHDLICVDMTAPKEARGEFRQADLSVPDETIRALDGSDLVIHSAAIHPWKKYTDEQYLDCNVKGTWNVFRAAAEHGITRVILTSSIAACGYSPEPERCPVDESFQEKSPRNIYSITKRFQEQIAQYSCLRDNVEVIALRPPNFTPKSPLQTGTALLSGCLLVEDIASAHVKALDAWDRLKNSFEPFFITPMFPYSPEEIFQLSDDPKGILDKHFPGAWDWFKERGIELSPRPAQYDNSKAKQVLDWEPEYAFGHWWAKSSSSLS